MKPKNFSERGQALIVIAIAAIGLFALVGLAIDGSVLYSDHRHAQNAADTAALAGSLAKVNGDTSWKVKALDRALSNGYNNNLVSNTVTVYSCDETDANCGPYAGDANFVKVVISSNVKTFFAKVVGVLQTHNRVEALSIAKKTSSGGPFYPGSAITSLKTGNCNGVSSKDVYVGGNAEVQIWAAGFGSASTDGNCIKFSSTKDTQVEKQDPVCPTGLTTAASQTELNTNAVLSSLKNPDNCSPFTVAGASGFTPPPDLGVTCGTTNSVLTGSTLSPGNWDTSVIKAKDVSTFQAGTYCITGNLTLNKNNITGNGVTFVMKDGSLKLDGNITVNLTAPTTAKDSFGNSTKGLLIYYAYTNSSTFTMGGTGSMNATMAGTVMAPNSDCSFQGTLQIQKGTYQFICSTWQASGTADIQIVYDSTQLYNQTNPAQVGLMQ